MSETDNGRGHRVVVDSPPIHKEPPTACATVSISFSPRPESATATFASELRSLALYVFVAGAVGAVVLTVAYDLGPAALVGPVSGTYPIIATLGAAAFLKEKLNWRIVAALVVFVLGLVFLSMV